VNPEGERVRDAILTCTQKLTWNQQLKSGKTEKLESKKQVCSEVSVNSWGNHGVSPREEKEGYGGKDLQKRKVLSLE